AHKNPQVRVALSLPVLMKEGPKHHHTPHTVTLSLPKRPCSVTLSTSKYHQAIAALISTDRV
ncbi:MAG TPA: hypothetical protein P5291_03405, partial [Flavobacteriales bacterium]|nr:hypothetical protein [Flavobacteriales bacterium]